MKTAIVCYSFTHNNLILAGDIIARTGGTLFNIEEKKSRNRLTIFLDMMFHRVPAIKDYLHLDDRFDHHILIAPIWAGKIASPLKAFLLQEGKKIRSYSFISVCGGDNAQMPGLEKELTTLLGKPPIVLTQLSLKKLSKADPASLANYRISKDDLAAFSEEIDEFITRSVPSDSLVGR